MNTETPYLNYNLDHLGLIAGMVDELGLSELIDTVIKQDHEQRQISLGACPRISLSNEQPLFDSEKF
jgi:hypothetical protein